MALKTGIISKPATGDVTFGGVKFTTGAKSNQTLIANLTTKDLKGAGGSSPGAGSCSIVGELGANYDLRDRIDIKVVKKALNKPAVINKIQKVRKPGPVLELLGLDGLLLISDYNWFNAGKFVRGHLLPESLGGPGVDWNLTPMGGNANHSWHADFEKPVRRDLVAAEKIEKSIGHRVVIEYKVRTSGSMSAWFSTPTPATVRMLSKLPAKVSGSVRIVGFEPKKGNAPISLQDKAKFKNLFNFADYELTL